MKRKTHTSYQDFQIEVEVTPTADDLWTWNYVLRAPDGARVGPFGLESPDMHLTPDAALKSAIADSKARIDGFHIKQVEHPCSVSC